MEKQRKYKVFVVVALMFTIGALSIAFAAFSKVLTINSSATVTPNEEDFKVVTYGFKDEDSMWSFDGSKEFEEDYLSNEKGYGYLFEDNSLAPTATIVNDKNSSSIDVNVTFSKEQVSYLYYLVVKNEGKYDAYIDLKNLDDYNLGLIKAYDTCTTENNTELTQEELNNVCKNVDILIMGYTSQYEYIYGSEEEPYYKLSVGDYILLELYINASQGSMISESYKVNFNDIKINFSTAP